MMSGDAGPPNGSANLGSTQIGVEGYGWPDTEARTDDRAPYYDVEAYGWPDTETRADDRAAYYFVGRIGCPDTEM